MARATTTSMWKKCPSGGSCSILGGPVGLVSIRQRLYLRPGEQKEGGGGRELESEGRDKKGGGRKKERTQEDERLGTLKPTPP